MLYRNLHSSFLSSLSLCSVFRSDSMCHFLLPKRLWDQRLIGKETNDSNIFLKQKIVQDIFTLVDGKYLVCCSDWVAL